MIHVEKGGFINYVKQNAVYLNLWYQLHFAHTTAC